MEYNTKREQLKFTDYGRNVYKMIGYAKTIEDREERNYVARRIVEVMATVNPKVKENADWEQKLWDHMRILANGELDVDCPFGELEAEPMNFKPRRLQYKNEKIRWRHYGKSLENMTKKLSEMEEGEEKEELKRVIAHQMKRSYLQWNRDTVDDELIWEQYDALTGGDARPNGEFELNARESYIGEEPQLAEAAKKKKRKRKRK